MRRRLAYVLLLFATGGLVETAACSDEALDAITVAESCPARPIRGPELFAAEPGDRLIDDFESGDGRIAPAANRTGRWVLGTDASSGLLTAEVSSRCAARGSKAGHFQGAGFTNWGANWTAVFVEPSSANLAQPYDGRSYSGISFFAAAGPTALPPYDVPVGITTIDNAWNGGTCTRCMDYYATTIPLSASWQRVVIPFSALAQAGWGSPLVAMRRDQLVGFIIWPTQQFDIWIDDVRLEP